MRRRLVIFGLLVLALAGCEEQLTDVSTDRPFTMYGVLSPDLERQVLRVIPIRPLLESTGTEEIDAVVSSTDLATGEVRLWDLFLLEEKDGSRSHAFSSDFRVEYGRRYRIEAVRSDGAFSYVEVIIPPMAEMVPLAGRVESATRAMARVLVKGDPPALMRHTRLLKNSTVYHIRAQGAEWWIEVDHFGEQPLMAEGREFEHNLFTDLLLLHSRMGRYHPPNTIELLGLTTRLILANEEWAPPDDVFDFDTLAQPGVMSNVENGYGFVGAGYWLELDWLPDDPALLGAGGFKVP